MVVLHMKKSCRKASFHRRRTESGTQWGSIAAIHLFEGWYKTWLNDRISVSVTSATLKQESSQFNMLIFLHRVRKVAERRILFSHYESMPSPHARRGVCLPRPFHYCFDHMKVIAWKRKGCFIQNQICAHFYLCEDPTPKRTHSLDKSFSICWVLKEHSRRIKLRHTPGSKWPERANRSLKSER